MQKLMLEVAMHEWLCTGTTYWWVGESFQTRCIYHINSGIRVILPSTTVTRMMTTLSELVKKTESWKSDHPINRTIPLGTINHQPTQTWTTNLTQTWTTNPWHASPKTESLEPPWASKRHRISLASRERETHLGQISKTTKENHPNKNIAH